MSFLLVQACMVQVQAQVQGKQNRTHHNSHFPAVRTAPFPFAATEPLQYRLCSVTDINAYCRVLDWPDE